MAASAGTPRKETESEVRHASWRPAEPLVLCIPSDEDASRKALLLQAEYIPITNTILPAYTIVYTQFIWESKPYLIPLTWQSIWQNDWSRTVTKSSGGVKVVGEHEFPKKGGPVPRPRCEKEDFDTAITGRCVSWFTMHRPGTGRYTKKQVLDLMEEWVAKHHRKEFSAPFPHRPPFDIFVLIHSPRMGNIVGPSIGVVKWEQRALHSLIKLWTSMDHIDHKVSKGYLHEAIYLNATFSVDTQRNFQEAQEILIALELSASAGGGHSRFLYVLRYLENNLRDLSNAIIDNRDDKVEQAKRAFSCMPPYDGGGKKSIEAWQYLQAGLDGVLTMMTAQPKPPRSLEAYKLELEQWWAQHRPDSPSPEAPQLPLAQQPSPMPQAEGDTRERLSESPQRGSSNHPIPSSFVDRQNQQDRRSASPRSGGHRDMARRERDSSTTHRESPGRGDQGGHGGGQPKHGRGQGGAGRGQGNGGRGRGQGGGSTV